MNKTMDALLKRAYELFVGKGYDPIDQFIGYLNTGDVSYFPVEDNIRASFQQTTRETVLHHLVSFFCKNLDTEEYYKKIYDTYKDVITGLFLIYVASSEKGYNPEFQLYGFVSTWDVACVTSYKGARNNAMKLDHEEVLLFFIEFYLNNMVIHKPKKHHK